MNLLYFFSELILSSIDIDATGDWECLVKNSYGNSSKQVEIVVLETAAPYCPAERIINNKGDFRYDFLGLECVSCINVGTNHIYAYMILQCQLQITYFSCHFDVIWWEGGKEEHCMILMGNRTLVLQERQWFVKVRKSSNSSVCIMENF